MGKVLKKEGYTGVRINKVAQVAGVSKKLIYDYFKDFDGLTKAYLEQVDFWHMKELRNESIEIKQLTRDIIFNVLKSDFEYFQNSIDMQKICCGVLVKKIRPYETLPMEEKYMAISCSNFQIKCLKSLQLISGQ